MVLGASCPDARARRVDVHVVAVAPSEVGGGAKDLTARKTVHTLDLAMPVAARLSRAEYLALPEAPDGLRCELVSPRLPGFSVRVTDLEQ